MTTLSQCRVNRILAGSVIGVVPLALTAYKSLVPILIALLACVAAVQWRSRPTGSRMPWSVRMVALTWSGYALAMLALVSWHGLYFAEWDNPSRFLIVALLLIGLAWGQPSARAFVVSCCAAQAGMLLLSVSAVYSGAPRAGLTTNPIQLGTISMLWGLAALPWCREPSMGRLCRGLAGLACGTAVVVAGLSGTRGVFFALGVCIMAATTWVVRRAWCRRAKPIGITLVIVAAVTMVAALYWLANDTGMIARSIVELRSIADGNFNTSVGLRILMWRAAWAEFLSHPWLGGGDFSTALTEQMRQIDWPQSQAPFTHAHSDWLQMLATCGLVGLVVLAAVLITPAVAALRVSRDYSSLPPAAAALLLSLLFFAVSMTTQTVFAHQNGSLGYALLIGALSVMLPISPPDTE